MSDEPVVKPDDGTALENQAEEKQTRAHHFEYPLLAPARRLDATLRKTEDIAANQEMSLILSVAFRYRSESQTIVLTKFLDPTIDLGNLHCLFLYLPRKITRIFLKLLPKEFHIEILNTPRM